MVLLLRKRVPEPQSFVTRTCHDRLTLWAHRKIENAVCVTGERGDHVECWVLPDADLILRGRG